MAFQKLAPVLPVRSVARSLELYRKLGFEGEAYEEGGDNPIYGFLSSGPVDLHLALVEGVDPMTNTSACYLYVDDADALYRAWKAAQVEGRLVAPVDTEYGLREMAYVDPDGNLLRIGSELCSRP
jgi:catechol 2,3-dioxygenase-like lactoylglutathione lyase family enzyme